MEQWGNPTQTLQASNTSRLPLHIGEGEAESPQHILCVDQDCDMRQHELRRVHLWQDGGLVPCTRVYALDPSLGVGWQEIFNCYLVELARRLDASMATTERTLWITKGARGPDCCWDPSGILHHIVESVGHGSSYVMDSVVGCTHLFISPSEFLTTLVIGWIGRGAGRFHELSWHVGLTWDRRMVRLLWQELVGGGGIVRPPDRASYGDSAFSLIYWALELLRSNMVALVLIACEELSHIGVLGQMRRCRSHRGGCTSRVADAWAHMG